jgi:hypothetical protein
MASDGSQQVEGFIQAMQYISACLGSLENRLENEEHSHDVIIQLLTEMKSAIEANTKAIQAFSGEICTRDLLQHIDEQQKTTTSTINNIVSKGGWVVLGISIALSALITILELSGNSIHDIIEFLTQ